LNQAGTDAAGAGFDVADGAIEKHADALEVWTRDSLGFVIRVTDVVTDQPLFFTIETTISHKVSENAGVEGSFD
jgi:hypothetical protein